MNTLDHCGYAEEVVSFAQREQIKLIEASAKSGKNIDLIFELMVYEVESGSQGDLDVNE